MKLVINRCHGGFGLSDAALAFIGCSEDEQYDLARNDDRLIRAVETLGKEANASYSDLKVVEFAEPHWEIDEYDGLERVLVSDAPIKSIYN